MGVKGGSVSWSALTNGSAELAGVAGSAGSWVRAPLRERGKWRGGVTHCSVWVKRETDVLHLHAFLIKR